MANVHNLVDSDPCNAGFEDQSQNTFCPDFLKSIQQLGSTFRCIPLTPITVYLGPLKVWQTVPTVLKAHKMIQDTGIPNFLGLQIPVKNKLKVSSWRKNLCVFF